MMRLIGFATFLGGLTGCDGSGQVVVHGQLTVNGQPWSPPANYTVMLSLIPDDTKNANPYSGEVKSDGEFVVRGDANGKGVPSGVYRVSLITNISSSTQPDDLFHGQYLPACTALTIDVSSRKEIVTLDVQPHAGRFRSDKQTLAGFPHSF